MPPREEIEAAMRRACRRVGYTGLALGVGGGVAFFVAANLSPVIEGPLKWWPGVFIVIGLVGAAMFRGVGQETAARRVYNAMTRPRPPAGPARPAIPKRLRRRRAPPRSP